MPVGTDCGRVGPGRTFVVLVHQANTPAMPRFSSVLLTRWIVVLLFVVCSSSVSPVRPTVTVAAALRSAPHALATAWQHVWALGSAVEHD